MLRAVYQSSAVHGDVFLIAHSSDATRRWTFQMLWKYFLHTRGGHCVWTQAVCSLQYASVEDHF